MFEPKYIDAVQALVGGTTGVGGKSDGPIEKIYYPESFTPPSEDVIQSKLKELKDEYDAQEYARKRQAEYPPWNEQLDKIFHDGVAKWKSEMVQPVKDKYPKPE